MASWQSIARDNLRLARMAAREADGERTACSRAYYAAFSALTAYLASTSAPMTYTGGQVTPPHRQVRSLVIVHGDPVWRSDVARLFTQLDKARLDADYRNEVVVTKRDAQNAIKTARWMMGHLGVR